MGEEGWALSITKVSKSLHHIDHRCSPCQGPASSVATVVVVTLHSNAQHTGQLIPKVTRKTTGDRYVVRAEAPHPAATQARETLRSSRRRRRSAAAYPTGIMDKGVRLSTPSRRTAATITPATWSTWSSPQLRRRVVMTVMNYMQVWTSSTSAQHP